MATSKTFALINNITTEKIGDHIIAWFQNTKNMIVEGGKTANGYFIQARDHDDNWKKISGLTKAIQVQFITGEGQYVLVNCAFGKWSDKVGAGVLGWVLFAPLAATAAFGAVKQSKLPEEVFAEIEKFIMSGGVSAVVAMGMKLSDTEVACPNCKTRNSAGQKFCKECGAKLGKSCPHCGSAIDHVVKFCPQCGGSTEGAACGECGALLAEGQMFCGKCGKKVE